MNTEVKEQCYRAPVSLSIKIGGYTGTCTLFHVIGRAPANSSYMLSKFSAIVAIALISGCSAGQSEVQGQLERFLGNSFEGEFEILSSSYSFAIGDDATTVDARFTERAHEELVALVGENDHTVTDAGMQMFKQESIGTGYDYLLLHVSPSNTVVHLQYGDE